MEHQNWKTSILTGKRKENKKSIAKKMIDLKDTHVMSKKGKVNGNSNLTGKQMYKLMNDENYDIPKVTVAFKIAMAQARLNKGLKQKELAHKIGVKESIVSGYEKGKFVPEERIIRKIERVLEVKLPRTKKA